jgi:hypothetical protein
MKNSLVMAAIVSGLLWNVAAADEKPSDPAAPPAETAKPDTEARVRELEAKVEKLEAEVERLGKVARSAPVPSPSGRSEARRFMDLPPDARQKFIEEMKANRERMMNASPEERATYAKKIFERIESDAAAKKADPAPPVPTEEEGKESK